MKNINVNKRIERNPVQLKWISSTMNYSGGLDHHQNRHTVSEETKGIFGGVEV
jgi:hypothetical protein